MYPFFIVLFLLVQVFGFSQSIQVWFEAQSTEKWTLQGKSDLPELANLVAVLVYEKEEVPESRQYKQLHQGKFSFDYAIKNKKMPAGQYSWQVASLQAWEGKTIFSEELFYYKNPYEKRKEIRQEMLFWVNFLAELQEYVRSLKEKGRSLLQKKEDSRNIRLFLEEIARKRLEIAEKWQKKIGSEAFPRSQKIQRQSQDLLQNVQKFSNMMALRLLLGYNLSLPPLYMQLKQSSPTEQEQKKAQERQEKQIRTLSRQILAGFPLPERLGSKELEEDILWFNSLFKNIATEYQKSSKSFALKQWEQKTAPFLEEIEGIALCAEDYGQSPLTPKYPSLASSVKALHQSFKILIEAYTKELLQKEKMPVPSSLSATPSIALVVKTLRENMENLLQIIQKEKDNATAYKENAEKQVSDCFSMLKKQYEEIQETCKIQQKEEFFLKESYHKTQHQNFLQKILTWQPYFPEDYLALRKASLWLITRLEFQRQILEGKLSHNTQTKAQLKEMDLEIALFIHQIQKNLEKETSPK